MDQLSVYYKSITFSVLVATDEKYGQKLQPHELLEKYYLHEHEY